MARKTVNKFIQMSDIKPLLDRLDGAKYEIDNMQNEFFNAPE